MEPSCPQDIVLNQVRVYHERVYADNVVSNFWFVRSFSSQPYSKFITNITSEIVSQMPGQILLQGESQLFVFFETL